MHCPICGRTLKDESELMACLTQHMQQEVARQARDMQRVYLMMMASQLTMACVSTHNTPQDVVSTFKEVFTLIDNLVDKNDVSAEIDQWLQQRRNDDESGTGAD